jgi:hypothetical protein
MSHVPGRRDHDWPYILRVPAQPVENVPVAVRSPPKVQSRAVPTLSEGSMVPWAYCVTWGDNQKPREAESRMGIADPEE